MKTKKNKLNDLILNLTAENMTKWKSEPCQIVLNHLKSYTAYPLVVYDNSLQSPIYIVYFSPLKYE